MVKEGKKYIEFAHHRFHGSFAVIDNTRKKVSTYDPGIQISGSHKRSNEILKASLESTTELRKLADRANTGTSTRRRGKLRMQDAELSKQGDKGTSNSAQANRQHMVWTAKNAPQVKRTVFFTIPM